MSYIPPILRGDRWLSVSRNVWTIEWVQREGDNVWVSIVSKRGSHRRVTATVLRTKFTRLQEKVS